MSATILKFEVVWHGEIGAGIHSGSEEVTIQFRYGHPLDSDTIEYWHDAVRDFFDGSTVTLIEQKDMRAGRKRK